VCALVGVLIKCQLEFLYGNTIRSRNMDIKHYGMCNLKYKDARKAQCVKHVVEKRDYELSC